MGGHEFDEDLLRQIIEKAQAMRAREQLKIDRLRWMFGKGPKPKDEK